MDLGVAQLKAEVEQDFARLMSLTGLGGVSKEDASGIRQFLCWRRLRVGGPVRTDELAQQLARFVLELGSDPECQADPAALRAMDESLVRAQLKRTHGRLTPLSLRRRVEGLSGLMRALGLPPPLTERAVRDAFSTIGKADRMRRAGGQVAELLSSPALRLRLLGTCDGSLSGARDRAILHCWFATGLPLRTILQADVSAVRQALSGCKQTPARAEAEQVFSAWCAAAALQSGAAFRRVRFGGALGARMTMPAAQRMISTRLAMAEARS